MDLSLFVMPMLLAIMAGITTGAGGFLAMLFKKQKLSYLCIGMGFSAGVMIFISFVELLNVSVRDIGFAYSALAFFIGIGIFYFVDLIIPHIHKHERHISPHSKLSNLSYLILFGIAIHNFPEGIAIASSALYNPILGVTIAITIALHNIPEGIAVAMPLYYATKNKSKAVWASFISGMATPVGTLIGLFILLPFMNQFLLNIILSGVAGIMVFISIDELLPYAFKYKEKRPIILGVFAGMLLAALSLLSIM